MKRKMSNSIYTPLEKLYKQASMLTLPSMLWAVHAHPNYHYVAICQLKVESLAKIGIEKAILLTLDGNGKSVIVSFFINNELVHMPVYNRIQNITDCSEMIQYFHNIRLCQNYNCDADRCQKYINFPGSSKYCEECARDTESSELTDHESCNKRSECLCFDENSNNECKFNHQISEHLNFNKVSTSEVSGIDSFNKTSPCLNCDESNTNGYSLNEADENYGANSSECIGLHRVNKTNEDESNNECGMLQSPNKHLNFNDGSNNNYLSFDDDSNNGCSSFHTFNKSDKRLNSGGVQHKVDGDEMNDDTRYMITCLNTDEIFNNSSIELFATSFEADEHKAELTAKDNSATSMKSPQQHQCSVCNKVYNKRYNLQLHLKSHLGSRSHVCSFCLKSYTNQSNLTTHIRTTHLSNKSNPCTLCEMTFLYPRDLRLHMRKHTDERPYQCSYCDKCFKKKVHLTVHTRTHTGEKPHTCDICGKAFTTTGNLSVHKRTNHKDACVK